MIKVDTRELQRFEKTLLELNRKALPYATRQTVNALAFGARKEWQSGMASRLTLRSRFPIQSVRVDRAQGLAISAQEATVGSIADFMADLESGITEHKRGKHGVPVPGAPLGRRAMPKTHRMSSIKLLPRVHGPDRQQIAASLSMARKRGGEQFAFLKLKRGKEGIYKLDPSKKRLAVKKIWSLSKSSVTVPPHPTMGPAVQRELQRGPEHYRKALEFQLRRLGMQGSL